MIGKSPLVASEIRNSLAETSSRFGGQGAGTLPALGHPRSIYLTFAPPLQKFRASPWPQEEYGHFYDADAFIVLNVSVILARHSIRSAGTYGPRHNLPCTGDATLQRSARLKAQKVGNFRKCVQCSVQCEPDSSSLKPCSNHEYES